MELGELVHTVSLFIMQLYKLMELGELVPTVSLVSLTLSGPPGRGHGGG